MVIARPTGEPTLTEARPRAHTANVRMDRAARGASPHPDRREHVRCAKTQVSAIIQGMAVGKSNIVQEAFVDGPTMALFPGRDDWNRARADAGLATTGHDDMHAGELETSILLHTSPHVVAEGNSTADFDVPDRPHLLTAGIRHYTDSGVIGRPSLGTAAKGKAIIDSLVESFKDYFHLLRQPS
jgi:hypothetical protein